MKKKLQPVLNYDFASLYPTSFGKSLWLFEKERLRKERKEKLQKIKENSEKL